MEEALKLPIIDLSASDQISSTNSIRQACIECGFFHLVNHGVEGNISPNWHANITEATHRFLSRTSTPIPAPQVTRKRVRFCIGPFDDVTQSSLNQWPSENIVPSWRPTMESYYRNIHSAGKRLISLLIALALNLDEDFFEKVETRPTPFLCLLHYPGQLGSSNQEIYGASAHSDFGIATLPGLQAWEDVLHVKGYVRPRT